MKQSTIDRSDKQGSQDARLPAVGRSLLGIAACCAVLVAVGCQTTSAPPSGNTGGRIDPYRQTSADGFSREVSSVTLLEFADQAAQDLALKLANVSEIRDRPTKVVLEIGAIENNTNTPTSDFAAIQRRVFLNMLQVEPITKLADIVEKPEVMDGQAVRLRSNATPVTATSDDTYRYSPEDTYILNGSFSEITRGNGVQSTYVFDVTVSHLASRRLVFATQLDSKQYR